MNNDFFNKFTSKEVVKLRKILSEMSGKSEEDIVKSIYEQKFLDNAFFDKVSKNMSSITVMFKNKLSSCKTKQEEIEVIYNLMISVTVLLSIVPLNIRNMIHTYLLENGENIDKLLALHKNKGNATN